MGEITYEYENHATLPEIAAIVAKAFPFLEGRAIAVSAEEIEDKNDVTLPIALIALVQGIPNGSVVFGQSARSEIIDQFAIQFMVAPEKYERANGNGESPLWAYYNYEKIRDRLFGAMNEYCMERGIQIEYLRLGVESTDFAVYVTFLFRQIFEWCDESEQESSEFVIVSKFGRC